MDQLAGSSYAQNTRFQIAKSSIDQLFVKWLTFGTTDKLVNTLLAEIDKPGPTLAAPPSPIFVSAIQTPHSPKAGGGLGSTPPRSPSGEKYFGKTLSPKTSGSLFDIGGAKNEKFPQQNLASNFGSAATGKESTSPTLDANELSMSKQSQSQADETSVQGFN